MIKSMITALTLCLVPFSHAQTISANLRFDLALGNDESKPREYLFSSPKFISTDSKNNIFVADRNSAGIRIFNEKGEFIKTIGARGQGPGEFLIDGDLPRKQLKLVLAWTELHQDELAANWEIVMNGEQPFRIQPLQ